MKYLVSMFAVATFAGCASPSLMATETEGVEDATEVAVVEEPAETISPPTPPPPPPSATTADDFDTTTDADREVALDVAIPAAETPLGTTLATLGSPADPGIWLKTPLVSEISEGRIDFEGRSINVELRPSGGEAGSGSQISLPAMRLLNAPLTGIIEIDVFAG